jgi:hypothetical protein
MPGLLERARRRLPNRLPTGSLRAPAVALAAVPFLIFVFRSPLPPSFAADSGRFEMTAHDDLARQVLAMIPANVPVSAQAAYVPHLAGRHEVFEFPQVGNSDWVLLDDKSFTPVFDQPAFGRCLAALPGAGYAVAFEQDGITLWHRDDAAVKTRVSC